MAHLLGKQGDNLYEGDGAVVVVRLDDPVSWHRAIYTVICAVHGSRGRRDVDYAMELLTDRIHEARHEYLRLKDDPAKAKQAYKRHWGHQDTCDCPLCKRDREAVFEEQLAVPDDPEPDAAAKGGNRVHEPGEWLSNDNDDQEDDGL